MSNFIINGLIYLLGAFFFGLLIYGFYIVLKPAPKNREIKHTLKPKMRS
jgi:hypothetical protein